MSGPRVFGTGDLTVAVSPSGLSVWASQTRIDFVRTVELRHDAETGQSVVEVSFYESHDPAVALRIEESVRVARTLPWVKVRTT